MGVRVNRVRRAGTDVDHQLGVHDRGPRCGAHAPDPSIRDDAPTEVGGMPDLVGLEVRTALVRNYQSFSSVMSAAVRLCEPSIETETDLIHFAAQQFELEVETLDDVKTH